MVGGEISGGVVGFFRDVFRLVVVGYLGSSRRLWGSNCGFSHLFVVRREGLRVLLIGDCYLLVLRRKGLGGRFGRVDHFLIY